MTRTELFNYIDNPNLIEREALAAILELLNQYPFSASLRMMYLKGLNNEEDIAFSEELKKASICIPNRKKIYALLRTTIQEKEEKEDGHLDLDAKNLKNGKESEIEKKEFLLEKEIMSERIASQYLIEASDELPSVKELIPRSKQKKNSSKKVKRGKKQEIDFFSFIGSKSNSKTEDDALSQEEKLNAFMKQKEKALKGKQRIVTTEKWAKRSLNENENLITETLAEIFVQQKRYGRAIKAYKKLGLKYPEKSLYFAAQLKKVKKLKSEEK